MNDPVSVVDLISDARRKAVETLCDLFGHDQREARALLTLYPDTLSVLQGMPDELSENVAVPIIRRFFEDYGYDAKNPHNVKAMAGADKLVAAGVMTAVQAVMQQVRHEEAQRQQSRSRLLRPGGAI